MTGGEYFFQQFIAIVVNFFNQTVNLLNSLHVGPLTWWQWIIGFFAVSLIISFIHMLAGERAPSLGDFGSGLGRSETHDNKR